MYNQKTFLAIIPARGGSKGIPHKNIVRIAGKPLIAYTIEEAKKSKYIDRVIISTDDQEIAKESALYGAEVPFFRPANLAEDDSKTIDALLHAINELQKENFIYDYLILLQPTQPLRKVFHIDEAIEKIVDRGAESLASVSKVNDHPLLIRSITDDKLKNLLSSNSTVRRQDFTDFYKINGAIYINEINCNFNTRTSLNDNKLPYIMDNKYDLDIDETFDLEIFKLRLLQEKQGK